MNRLGVATSTVKRCEAVNDRDKFPNDFDKSLRAKWADVAVGGAGSEMGSWFRVDPSCSTGGGRIRSFPALVNVAVIRARVGSSKVPFGAPSAAANCSSEIARAGSSAKDDDGGAEARDRNKGFEGHCEG